ncbi:hypothetical protein V6N13_085044 [Hibiscus sabdariffa]
MHICMHLYEKVDLVRGYYDAGDNVKFGLPMAFTITMFSWGVIEYGDEISGAGEYTYALEAIKWGTDYFIKAHTHPNVLWAQVGDGDTDHYCWQRLEDMTTSRQAYKINKRNPGSDVAGSNNGPSVGYRLVGFALFIFMFSVPGNIACFQELEALTIASAAGKPLSERLLLFDALSSRTLQSRNFDAISAEAEPAS